MGFSRQEYWTACHFFLQGIFPTLVWNLFHSASPALAGRFPIIVPSERLPLVLFTRIERNHQKIVGSSFDWDQERHGDYVFCDWWHQFLQNECLKNSKTFFSHCSGDPSNLIGIVGLATPPLKALEKIPPGLWHCLTFLGLWAPLSHLHPSAMVFPLFSSHRWLSSLD